MDSTDSLPTSSLRFRSIPDLAAIPAPVEWTQALVELVCEASSLADVQFTVNGSPVPVQRRLLLGHERLVADWERRGPGRYHLEVRCCGQVDTRDVDIIPARITPEAFARLLEDLERVLPCSIATGISNAGGLHGVERTAMQPMTAQEDLRRLQLAVHGDGRPGLVEVLTRIARAPHHVFAAQQEWVKVERARRPRPNHLPLGLRKANNISSQRGLRTVADSRVEESFDVYENRLVRAFVDAVEHRLRALVLCRPGSEMAQAAAPLLEELADAHRRASFLAQVGVPRGVPTRVTMVLLRRPEYRAALEGYRAFCQSLRIELRDDRIESPLENLPYLYELWGTLRVVDCLLKNAAGHGYRLVHQRLVTRDAGGLWFQRLQAGEPAMELQHPGTGTRVRLVPQRTYSAQGGVLRSLSFAQVPDITIEVRAPEGEPLLYLLDPKYKLDSERLSVTSAGMVGGSPLKVDIDKMHAYRDAIRDAGGRAVVRYAAIMYPGPSRTYSDGLEALNADPERGEELEALLGARLQRWLGVTARHSLVHGASQLWPGGPLGAGRRLSAGGPRAQVGPWARAVT